MNAHPLKAGVAGIILAGGLARRLDGRDKPLVMLAGRPLLAHCIARLSPQCAPLVLSANGDPARFAASDLPVVPDDLPGSLGPLAGVLAALDWLASASPATTHALSLPADTPFVPADLVARLERARCDENAEVAVSASGGRPHHAVALWPLAARPALRDALVNEGQRSIGAFAARFRVAAVEWPVAPFDPFFNVNTPDDLAEAERIVASAA